MLLLPEKIAGPGQGPAAAGRTTFPPVWFMVSYTQRHGYEVSAACGAGIYHFNETEVVAMTAGEYTKRILQEQTEK